MATALKKPSREKEEAREGDMSLSPHPLCVHILPSRKQNRENRIKSACNSNSHSNIAPSNDKRPLFVQIPATSSASLVSTSLAVRCLRPSNFFFYRRIFLNGFLRHQSLITRHQSLITRHQRFITRHQSFITRHQSLITRHQSFITRHQSFITRHQSLITLHQSLITCHQSFIARHQSLITHH